VYVALRHSFFEPFWYAGSHPIRAVKAGFSRKRFLIYRFFNTPFALASRVFRYAAIKDEIRISQEHTMHRPISNVPPYQGHIPISLVVKSLLFAVVVGALIVFQSVALLIIAALGFVFSLAIEERLHKLDQHRASARPVGACWVSDGGSFPGSEPESERTPHTRPSVIDGGSLEHHRG
jgi:hypothetical protein